VQPNFRYLLQDQKAAATEGDAAQYALAKLHLPEAHTLAHGEGVKVAIIDSGIDAKHPELAGSVIDSFDALGSKEGPHVHGTGIAGVIVSHAKLMGSAPSAKVIAIRAFGQAGSGAESNSYVILKALDYAAGHGAGIINMSFAGPKDALIERGITATAAKGEVMIAAAGNAGPKSPPLYPAANPNVIAVGATDAQDKLFAASNRGSYVALAAPGVDIFLPAPDGKYQITSGTSFSAAFVSGLAALMLERNPQLKAEDIRSILTSSAHDLGSPGRDDEFGAGEADAFAAVTAAIAATGVPSASSESGKAAASAPELKENAKENPSVSSVASDKTTAAETRAGAAQ
jgi:subtilisin family serine protease